jgi:hypothetical protein
MRRGLVAFVCLIGAVWLIGAAGKAAAAAPPANDDLAGAQVLSGPLPIDVTGTTVGATREIGEPIAAEATPSGHSIWFRWEPTSTGYVSIGACGSGERENLGVYTGTALGALSEVASSRFTTAPDCESNDRTVTFTAHAGTAYSIAVEGDGLTNQYLPPQSGESSIELHLSRPTAPANDDFANAATVETREISYPFANFGATSEPGEPDHGGEAGGASVWFRWTAPFTGGAFVQACPFQVGKESVAAAYTGSTLATLVPAPRIGSLSKCSTFFFATAGVTYSIAVDGVLDPKSGTAEMFESALSVHRVPPNDDFEDAAALESPLGGAFTQVVAAGYLNLGATKQPGEPDHAGNAGGHSVWFTWTAPFSGSVQISACQGDFPTALAVYTGSSLDALTSVTAGSSSSTEGCPMGGTGWGEVGFNTVAGTTYRLAVDGIDGAWGHFDLALWTSHEPEKPRPDLVTAEAPQAAKPKAQIAARHIDQRRHSAVFDLRSAQSGVRFRCKLDRRRFARCGAKVTYRHLAAGWHVFRALAVDPAGATGAPVKAAFPIRRSG